MKDLSPMSLPLTQEERALYEWQMWVPGFGEEGQLRLKNSTVLITRCGGLGGVAAYELAAAGIGRLVLAHGGVVRPSDLNRQILMTHDHLGLPRMESIERRLKDLNPRLEIVGVPENVAETNVAALVSQVDLIIDAAPRFEERLLLNRESVRLNKPMIECAVYELELHVTTFLPGSTGCLACLCPEPPAYWNRNFPIFGAVSGTAGCLAAMEGVKVLANLGQPLYHRRLVMDLRSLESRVYNFRRDPNCKVCGHLFR